jgi:hypothetical protein
MVFAVVATGCGVVTTGSFVALLCSAFTGVAGIVAGAGRVSAGGSAVGFGLSGVPPSKVGSTRSGSRLSAATDQPQAIVSSMPPTILPPCPNHAKDIFAAFLV